VCEPLEYETQSSLTDHREYVNLSEGINTQTTLSRLIQDYIYSLTAEDDKLELAIVKDETNGTRFIAKDPESTEDRKAATELTKAMNNFDEIEERNEIIAAKIMKKQHCMKIGKRLKPKELSQWKKDYIRENDELQMALLSKSV
jgi:hypothetical protein